MWQLTDCIEPPIRLPGDPEIPEILQTALAFHQQGQAGDAEKLYSEFLMANPQHPQALAFLGACLAQNGRYQEADALLMQSIQLAPELADPRYCRANILVANGQTSLAVMPYTYAVALGHPKAAERLDTLLDTLGDAERASSHRMLATFYVSKNMTEPALENSHKAVQLEPEVVENWSIFTRVLSRIRFTRKVSSELLDSIARAFTISGLDRQLLAGAAISAMLNSGLADLHHSGTTPGSLLPALSNGSLKKLTENHLFRRILSMVLVNDPHFEHWLTKLRAALVVGFNDTILIQTDYLGLVADLACQCFMNDYLWVVSDEERAAIEGIDEKLTCSLARDRNQATSSIMFALLAMYQPLYRHTNADQLVTLQWLPELSPVIQQQLTEPLEEQRLAGEIPSVLPESSDTSLEIRKQYEASPYPRWVNIPVHGEPVTLGQYIARSVPGLSAAEQRQSVTPKILVAGCGTGQAANYLALHVRHSIVTAVDLSLSGLAYARRKSNQLGLQSIEYLQGDILNLPMLGKQFDHINCYGVLHHLEDVGAGMRALAECLAPNGTMQIGIYSEMAQKPLIHARDFITERVGDHPSADEVRFCRQAIIDQEDDGLLRMLLEAPNFYNLNDFWNLVVKYRESYISLPELQNIITSLGLRFIGFQHSDPTVVVRYQKQYPQDPAMRNLDYWTEFETGHPNTFRSLYNFWLLNPAS